MIVLSPVVVNILAVILGAVGVMVLRVVTVMFSKRPAPKRSNPAKTMIVLGSGEDWKHGVTPWAAKGVGVWCVCSGCARHGIVTWVCKPARARLNFAHRTLP